MKITYDPEVDVIRIVFSNVPVGGSGTHPVYFFWIYKGELFVKIVRAASCRFRHSRSTAPMILKYVGNTSCIQFCI